MRDVLPDAEVLTSPARKPYPSRLIVETTTRCNLQCSMCVRQTPGRQIADGDLSPQSFAALEPIMPNLEAMVLNGIGEPLLHAGIVDFVSRGRKLMPASGWIGFQSNGLLVDEDRARSLLDAGLDRICLSIDSVSPEVFRSIRAGGELTGINRAFSALNSAKRNLGRHNFEIGIEFVVMRSNLEELPEVLRWAADHGISFALVTHLFPYDRFLVSQAVYDSNLDAAVVLFLKYRRKAQMVGLDICRYYEVFMKYVKTPSETELVRYVQEMVNEALSMGITLNVEKLIAMDHSWSEKASAVFDECRKIAARTGIDLKLPELLPKSSRRCDFVEDGSVFVSWDGNVHPCYFLWHRYRCFINGMEKLVRPKIFGNLAERGILEIWNDASYSAFRTGVVRYDYPFCFNCSFALCDYVSGEDFEQDCYINAEPCGVCLWCMGVFQCLR